MRDYSSTFGHPLFTTVGQAAREATPETLKAIDQVADLLEREADENLVHDHFQPEIAGPLQQALYFLQLVRTGAVGGG